MSYDPISFAFQVHNDAKRVERAYLLPHGLPHGATLEITPAQADIEPGTAAIFSCKLSLDRSVIRPGCDNDQGFRLTAWRIDEDADEPWGSCFYWVRPRVRTILKLMSANWYEDQLQVQGTIELDTDTSVTLVSQLPLRVRIRLEVVDSDGAATSSWAFATVNNGGIFSLSRPDFKGPFPARLNVQAWFDRTDWLASSRSQLVTIDRQKTPIIH